LRQGIHRDLFSVGTGKVLSGATSLLIRIYAMPFLDPAGYGVLSLGINCLTLFEALIGSALDLGTIGLITRGKLCEGRAILPAEKATIGLKLAGGAALAVFFALAGEWLGYRFLHGPGGRQFFLALAAGGTGILLLRSVQLYFQARLRFRVFAAIDLAHSALRIVLVAAVLYLGTPTAVSILWCFAGASGLVCASFLIYGLAAASWSGERPGWRDLRAVARSSAPMAASFGASAIASRLDVFLLALRGTPSQLGLYGAALTFATIPEVFGVYLAPVFLPHILPACRAGTFRAFFRRFLLLAYGLAGVLLTLGLLAGRPLLALVLPARYAPAIDLVMILLPGTLAVAVLFPVTLNFLMLTRPLLCLAVDSVAIPLLALAYFFLVPEYGAIAAAWITAIHRLSKAAVMQAGAYALARGPVNCVPAPEAPQVL
jgi:O-antigen/teichoic acid export membrane protein